MEYSCHRCGALVEEGTRFCPACAAPQIRVVRAEPESAPQPREWQSSEELGPAATPQPASAFQWRHAWPAVTFAGASMGAATLLLGFFFPLWMILSGTLAVTFYLRRTGLKTLPTALGARLGALSGLAAFVIFGIFYSVTLLVFGSEIREQMRQVMSAKMQSAATDPQAQALMQWFLSPQGLNVLIVLSMVILLVGFVILGMASGALWARMRAKK